MRLLLRSNAHRPTADGWEVAASPDTPNREVWQWDLRLVHSHAGSAEPGPGSERQAVSLPARDGSALTVQLTCDPTRVVARTEVMIAGAPATVERDVRELTVLVVGQGRARLEGRHELGALDAMVLEGDDPLTVAVERVGTEPTSVGVVRIRSAVEQPISWVP